MDYAYCNYTEYTDLAKKAISFARMTEKSKMLIILSTF
jgi:hypothetical protein